MKLVTLAIACLTFAACAKTSVDARPTPLNNTGETSQTQSTCTQEQLDVRNAVGEAFHDLYSEPTRKTAAVEIEKCQALRDEMSEAACTQIRGDGTLAEVGYIGRVKDLCEEFITDGASKTARRFQSNTTSNR